MVQALLPPIFLAIMKYPIKVLWGPYFLLYFIISDMAGVHESEDTPILDWMPLNDTLKAELKDGFYGPFFSLIRTKNHTSRSVNINLKVADQMMKKRDIIVENIKVEKANTHETGKCTTVFATVLFKGDGKYYCSVFQRFGEKKLRDPSRTINLSTDEFELLLLFFSRHMHFFNAKDLI